MKKSVLALVFLCACALLSALVNEYSFTSNVETYSEISGGTVLGTATNDDLNFNNLPLGFDFTYNHLIYNALSVNTNGFIVMGGTAVNSLVAISNPNGSASNNLFAALNRDIKGKTSTGELMVITSGTAPNRVFTVQWKNYQRLGAAYNADQFNFQIKLHETSNLIEFCYGYFVMSTSTNNTFQVGLRGDNNLDFFNRSVISGTNTWETSVIGTLNTSSCTMNPSLVPSNGLVYKFTSSNSTSPPGQAVIVTPTNGATLVNPNTAVIWSEGTGNPTGYKLFIGTDNPPTNMMNGTDLGNVTSFDPSPDFSLNTTYYWKVVPYNLYGDATGCPTWSFTTADVPSPATILSPADLSNGIAITSNLNWSSGTGYPSGYKLYFGTDNPPTNVINGTDIGAVTSYDPSPDMAYLTTYFWKVVPYNSLGDAANCPTWSFQTAQYIPEITTVTIGTGTTGSNTIPIDMYYKSSLSESFYYSTEINSSGLLTGITWYTNFVTNLLAKPTRIWVGESALTSFTSSWIPSTQLTSVFNGNVDYPSGTNSVHITFSTPYRYLGGNLVIMAQRPMDTIYFNQNDNFYVTSDVSHPGRTREYHNDTTELNPVSPVGGNLLTSYPNITMTFQHSSGTVQGTASSSGTPISGTTVTWTGTGRAVTTDANGLYSISDVIPGLQTFTATKYGFNDLSQSVTVINGQTHTLNFAMTAIPTVQVTGRVVQALNPSVGIAGASVVLSGYGTTGTVTNASGYFTFSAIYVNRAYTYAITADGYISISSPISVGSTNVDLGTLQMSTYHDLSALSLVGTNTPIVGVSTPYIVNIKNNGTLSETTYQVKLINTLTGEIASVAGPSIAPGVSILVTVNWTPSVQGAATIYSYVQLTGDENAANNITSTVELVAQPTGTTMTTVGTGTSFSNTIPLNMYYRSSLTETIFYPSEMNSTGIISGLSWHSNMVTTYLNDKPTRVWIGETDTTSLANGWIPSTQLNAVFDDVVDYLPGDKTPHIEFSTPYHYQGRKLVIMVQRPMDTNYFASTDYFYTSFDAVNTSRTREYHDDTTEASPATPPTGTVTSYYPNTTLFFLGDTTVLTGTITSSGIPVSGATVNLDGTAYGTITNTSGVYSILHITPGSYTVRVAKTDYYPTSSPVTIVMDQTHTLNFNLNAIPYVQISGHVIANTNTSQGLPGAFVTLNGETQFSATTNTSGDFNITVPGNISYTYSVSFTNLSTVTGSFTTTNSNINIGTIMLTETLTPPSQATAVYASDQIELHWRAPNATNDFMTESFEAETFPPTNWTQIVTDNSGSSPFGIAPTWNVYSTITLGDVTIAPHNGNQQAIVVWNVAHQDEWLKTSQFTCPANATLKFWMFGHTGSPNWDHYYVKVSTNGGTTWTILWDASALPEADNHYSSAITISLSAYAGQNIKLAWQAVDGDGNGLWYIWAIDDISISTPVREIPINMERMITESKVIDSTLKPIILTPNSIAFNRDGTQFHLEMTAKPTDSATLRSMIGFRVWRLQSGQEANEGSWTLLTPTTITNSTFNDVGWTSISSGHYLWAVKAIYSAEVVSLPVFTNSVPKLIFTADKTNAEIPVTVQFTESSILTDISRSWNFGDGIVSTVANPNHVYENPGTYSVSLTVTDLMNTSSTFTRTNYITATPHIPLAQLTSNAIVDFGVEYLGVTGQPQYIMIQNPGTGPLTISGVTFWQANPKFSVSGLSFPQVVAPSTSINIPIVFSPIATITVTDSIRIFSDAQDHPLIRVKLSGTGRYVPPAVPENVSINFTGEDAQLSWSPVTTSVLGTPIVPDRYIVLYNELPNDEDHFWYLGNSTGLSYTHMGVTMFRNSMFYRVVAVKFYRGEDEGIFNSLTRSGRKISWQELKEILR